MQKTAIFTVALSILVVLTVADFLVNKPIAQTSTLPSATKTAKEPPKETKKTTPPAELPQTQPTSEPSPKNEVSDFLDQRRFVLDSVTSGSLEAIGFRGMSLEKTPFDQMIFQLLDVGTYPNLSAVRYHLTDKKNIFGVLQEFEFQTEAETVALYADLKQKIGAFSPRVTSNETNQHGRQSFFMNDTQRAGTAFLVFRLQRNLFTFSYPKASHEFFKTLILSLAK